MRQEVASINLVQLDSFLTLAQTLNFTAASRDLFITQPSLSRNIALLEEELNLRLFHRDKQMVRLTSAGQSFLPYARRIKNAYDEAFAFAQSAAKGNEGEVRIGIATWLFMDSFPKLSARMARDFPHIKLTVRDGSQQEILNLLINRELDLILTAGHSLVNTPKLQKRLVDRIPLRLVVPAQHPLVQYPGPIPLELLRAREEPFLTVDTSSHATLRKVFPGSEILHINSITRLLTLIEANMGIALLQEGVRRLAVQNIAFLELRDDPFQMEAVAAWFDDKENLCLNELLQELFELLAR